MTASTRLGHWNTPSAPLQGEDVFQLRSFALFYSIAQALGLLSRKEALSGIVGLKEFCTGCWIGFDTWYIPFQSVANRLGIVLFCTIPGATNAFTTAKLRSNCRQH
jgi:hypothetical protein